MLDPSEFGGDVIISFLNTFVPNFKDDPVTKVKAAPTTVPALPRVDKDKKEKATFMDVHVKVQSGSSCIVEMQSQRHLMFDERALFYLCSTYARQIENLQKKDWYLKLKPTIALQILDYDSNKLRGITHEKVQDLLQMRSKKNPLPKGQYLKHYIMQDQVSKQALSHLHMIQVELPRYQGSLFPPQADFSITDWWLSILRFSSKYSAKFLEEQESRGIVVPDAILKAFSRLSYKKWNDRMQKEYKFELDYVNNKKEEVQQAEKDAIWRTKKEIVLSLLESKVSLEDICKHTKLPRKVVKKIRYQQKIAI